MTTIGDIIASAATGQGQDPTVLLRIGQLESSLDPAAHNPSGADGLFQFMPSTARAYGVNTADAASSADGAARLLRDNRAYLAKALGRDPTGAELYLAHQQGAGGAANLLTHPDAPAVSLVGTRAVIQNGGQQGMSARDYTSLWTNRYDGARLNATGAGAGYVAPMPSSASAPALPTLPSAQINPGAVLAASMPTDGFGAPAVPQRAPTVANGGAQAAEARRRALITGQGGLAALFA